MSETESRLKDAVGQIVQAAIRGGLRVDAGEAIFDQVVTNLAELPASDQRELVKELRGSLAA